MSCIFLALPRVLLGAASLGSNALVESTPADGAALENAPTVWTLTYFKDVLLNSASAEIISASGVRTQLPTPTYGVNNKQIVFTLPERLAGTVKGRWRLVGLDGQVVSARVSFSIVSSTTIPQTDANPSATTTTVVVAQVIPDEFVDDSVPEPVRFGVRLGWFTQHPSRYGSVG